MKIELVAVRYVNRGSVNFVYTKNYTKVDTFTFDFRVNTPLKLDKSGGTSPKRKIPPNTKKTSAFVFDIFSGFTRRSETKQQLNFYMHFDEGKEVRRGGRFPLLIPQFPLRKHLKL